RRGARRQKRLDRAANASAVDVDPHLPEAGVHSRDAPPQSSGGRVGRDVEAYGREQRVASRAFHADKPGNPGHGGPGITTPRTRAGRERTAGPPAAGGSQVALRVLDLV